MKKIITILLIVLCTLGGAIAQKQDLSDAQKQQRREEMKAEIDRLKVEYFSKQLELTALQAEKFWPLYNKYDAENRKTLQSRRQIERQLKKRAGTNADIEAWVGVDSKMAQINSRYIPQFRKILSDDQVVRMLNAEEGFKHVLLRELNLRRGTQNSHIGSQKGAKE